MLTSHTIYDHKGNEYPSKAAMCRAYHIKVNTFDGRVSRGYSVEEALTGKKVYDHLGNSFSSISAMCAFYNIPTENYYDRKTKGWNLEKILLTPVQDFSCYDHLGIKYASQSEMCSAYNLSLETFLKRMNLLNWDLQKALVTPVREMPNSNINTDHLGVAYTSCSEMCKAYNIDDNLFRARINSGWDIKTALTKPSNKGSKFDHLGVEYKNTKAMCDAYGIETATYNLRRRKGLSIEDALTIPSRISICTDHLGNTFGSLTEMANFYNMSGRLLSERLRFGFTIEDALTEPVHDMKIECVDHLGNHFESIKAMCTYHNVSQSLFYERRNKGLSLENCLNTIPTNSTDYEKAIAEFLSHLQIQYIQEYSYEDCLSNGGKKSRFDFFIIDYGLIEVDGEGHFKQIYDWNYNEAQINDELKTTYCEQHNIPLLRIRYDQIRDGSYKEAIDIFLANPTEFIHHHNPFLTETEYYSIRKVA